MKSVFSRSLLNSPGLVFERIQTDVGGFDSELLQKLGVDYCRERSAMPLRREGSRIVVGTTEPDDLFLLEDIKRRLGVAVLKHAIVTSSDILKVIDSFGEHSAESINMSDLLADVEEGRRGRGQGE